MRGHRQVFGEGAADEISASRFVLKALAKSGLPIGRMPIEEDADLA